MQPGDNPGSPLGDYLREIHSEPAFRKWCESVGSLAQAWELCDRADWMLHLLENSGQPEPEGLRRFCGRTFERFHKYLPDASRVVVLAAVADGMDSFQTDGSPSDPSFTASARATLEAAASMTQTVGNWTPARVILIGLAALHDDPMAAARGVSEQAGMAAQYIQEFPTATDWPDEMAMQAALIREIFGNPFEKF